MTNRLSELAKRVEELSGPDREVDAEICIAISRYASARAAFLHDGDIPSSAHNSRHVDHVAEVVDYNKHKGTFIAECPSGNRAIALCAAALRALASEKSS